MRTVTWRQVAALRLERQHLVAPAGPDTLVDVVAAHVGIQAQVMSSAEQALRARVQPLTRDDVRDALWRDRSLVKTWAMRGTLHLVAGTELPELVRGLGTRLNWLTPVWLRYFDVTADEMTALQGAIGDLLGEEPVTRQELADALGARLGDPAFAGRVTSSWGTFLKPAASAGKLAFGPDRGRNVTFVHPEAWLAIPMPEPHETGVDAVILRHLRAFPGASKPELARWWGVPPGRLTAALTRLGPDLELVDLEGTRAYVVADDAEALAARDAADPAHIRLLGGFDPYTLSLQKEAEPLLALARRPLVSRQAGWISAVLLVGGAVAGTWTHETKPRGTSVEVSPWRRLTRPERRAIEAEAEAIGAFLAPGVPVRLRVVDPA
ncbi:MAG TPA: winged helix DNA-binding domain-containing protein [Candidatus Limnocylindrales bacterium]|nr:winged helix DNA-binding domain-containing protein [Candidatus Limnocylindrales bacterium]